MKKVKIRWEQYANNEDSAVKRLNTKYNIYIYIR